MLSKIEYATENEKQLIISSNSSLILVEVQELFDGNYLIFSDTALPSPTIYVTVPQEDFNSLKQQNAQMLLALVNAGLM